MGRAGTSRLRRLGLLGKRAQTDRAAAHAREAYYASLARTWPAEALAARRAYEGRLSELATAPLALGPAVDLDVLSFACERDLPEQIVSIRSFLAHVGEPHRVTIVSDGSHSRTSRRLLEGIHRSIAVVDWRSASRPDLPGALWEYAEVNWRGRKLLVIASLAVERPVLYTDADVLFFARASELRRLPAEAEAGPRYLEDCEGDEPFLDPGMLEQPGEAESGVNAGFLFFPEAVDWKPALCRLERRLRSGRATYSGQTVVHLAMHGVGAHPFDRSRYVLEIDDRSLVEDPYVGPDTVLRHYVSPVRHKFWSRVT